MHFTSAHSLEQCRGCKRPYWSACECHGAFLCVFVLCRGRLILWKTLYCITAFYSVEKLSGVEVFFSFAVVKVSWLMHSRSEPWRDCLCLFWSRIGIGFLQECLIFKQSEGKTQQLYHLYQINLSKYVCCHVFICHTAAMSVKKRQSNPFDLCTKPSEVT